MTARRAQLHFLSTALTDYVWRPLARTDVSDASSVTVGQRHICVLHGDQTVSCWGDNRYGQLGNGTLDTSDTAVPVPGLTDVVEISAGPFHTCARRSDDTVWCWGHNGSGQLGQPVSLLCRPDVDTGCPISSTPVQVPGLP